VHIVVEGSTERSFVRDVLAAALWKSGVLAEPVLLGGSGHKGGSTNYARVRESVLVRLKQDRSACCSTMLDFYGLGKGFPGLPMPPNLANQEKVARIERAMAADIYGEVPDMRPDVRFVPYLQLHEFEGLLFSDPQAFATSIGNQDLARPLFEIRNMYRTPEDINDDRNTAPSKRIFGLYAGYRKVTDGTAGAKAVGIDRMRQECPHFNEWVSRLESLAGV
jgi:hypothetical protein